jgi:hypothetical protein
VSGIVGKENRDLTAYARVMKVGRTLGYVECEVKDQTGKLVAKAASTCMKLRQDRKEEYVVTRGIWQEKKKDLLPLAAWQVPRYPSSY